MIVKIDIVNKRPSVVGTPVIVCGNSGYTIEFTFDGEWASAAVKTARFVYVKGGAVKYQDVAFSGTVVEVPILSEIREVYVGVYAGDLRTTTPARIPCERSILCGTGTEHEEPDPDVYNQILEAVNQLIGEVGNHPARTDNPHGVTAEQVGARPDTWTPTAQEVGARPSDWMPTAQEVGARPDTWMPSASDVGAVPTACAHLTNKSIKEWALSLNYTGYAVVEPSTTDTAPEAIGGNQYAIAEAKVLKAGHWVELRVTYILTGCVAVLIYNNGWGVWEWDNAPMMLDTEYRTTERWNGKPVYVKTFKVDSLPNNSYVDVPYGISNLGMVIDCRGCANSNIVLPNISTSETSTINLVSSGDYFRITTHTDRSNLYAYVTLKFTKTT